MQRKAESVRRDGIGSTIGLRFVPNARRIIQWAILRIKPLVEENNWTRLGPIDPIEPISKTSLKPIY